MACQSFCQGNAGLNRGVAGMLGPCDPGAPSARPRRRRVRGGDRGCGADRPVRARQARAERRRAVEFLDSLLSQDIAAIAVGAGADATLLTHKGRMLAEVRVLRTEDELLLDTERIALQALFDALTRFKIGYNAELHKRTLENALFSLIGPRVDSLLQQTARRAEFAHVVSEVAAVRCA
jgi:hypothetical protein